LGIHRSSSGQFSNLCDLTLKYLHNLNTEFVICGDFIINFFKDFVFKQQIAVLFQTHNLFQSINFSVRVGKVSSSAVDNIFIDHGRIKSHYVSPVINGLPDYEAQYLVLSDVFNHHKNKQQSFRTKIISKEAITEFQNLLK
jgi:hypothetical protein